MVFDFFLLVFAGLTTCCGAAPMTPVSCYTASSGQWCRCCWARSSCSWRCAPARWPFVPRRSRRGSAPTRCARTSRPRPPLAAPSKSTSPPPRTLTPSCRRPPGPCRCSRCQCDVAIENTEAEQKAVFIQPGWAELLKSPMLSSWWSSETFEQGANQKRGRGKSLLLCPDFSSLDVNI